MDKLGHAIAIAILDQETRDAMSQLHDAVAIAIGRCFPVNDQTKFKAGISFLGKMKVC